MPADPAGPDRRKDGGPAPAELAGLGLQLAASIVLFLFAGQWLDERLGTGPWLTLLGVFVGFGGGFYSILRKLAPRRGPDQRDR